MKNLKEIINLEINTKSWKISHSLNSNQWKNLCIYLVNAIKQKKLNTRKFKEEYIEELRSLLSLNQTLSDEIIDSSKQGKIRYDQLNFLAIKTKKEKEIIFKNQKEKETYKIMREEIIPEMDEIIKLSTFLESKLDTIDNKFIYSLLYTWCKEFKPIIFSKSHLQPIYYPYFIISSLLRTTSELLCNFWVILDKNLQNDFVKKFKKENKTTNAKNCHINDVLTNNKFQFHIEQKYCKYCEGKKILWFTSNDLQGIKIKLQTFYSTFLNNSSNKVSIFLLEKKVEIDLILSSYCNFILWSNNTDHLNRIIHKNHYIFDVIKNVN